MQLKVRVSSMRDGTQIARKRGFIAAKRWRRLSHVKVFSHGSLAASPTGGPSHPGTRVYMKFLIHALAAVILLLGGLPSEADAAAKKKVKRRYAPPSAAMAVDLYSGRILHEKNAYEPRYPASITKVMTLYLLFDALRDGKLALKSELPVSAFAASQSPSKLGLKRGQTISVSDAIGALVTKSANDVAVVVAEALAKSEEDFARLMTQKARTIGMTATTFRNASGLPNPQQRTTAHDLLLMGRRIMIDHPDRVKAFRTKFFKYGKKVYRNHNSLLFSYKGMEGMKTGFTNASGFNLIASAKRSDKRVLAVVLGGPSARSRNAAMRSLLNTCWKKAVTEAAAEKLTRAKFALAAPATPVQPPLPVARVVEDAEEPVAVASADAPEAAEASEPAASQDASAPAAVAVASAAGPSATPASNTQAVPDEIPAELVQAPILGPEAAGEQVADAAAPAPAAPELLDRKSEGQIIIANVGMGIGLPDLAERGPQDATSTEEPDGASEAETQKAAETEVTEAQDTAEAQEAAASEAAETQDAAETQNASAAPDAAETTEADVAAASASDSGELAYEQSFPQQIVNMSVHAKNIAPKPEKALVTTATEVTHPEARPAEPTAMGTIQAAVEAEPDAPAPQSVAAVPDKAAAPAPGLEQEGPYQIQVGSFGDTASAQARNEAVIKVARKHVNGHAFFIMQAELPSGTVYRARYVKFKRKEAAKVCKSLKRRAIDCMVVRVPIESVQHAQAGP